MKWIAGESPSTLKSARRLSLSVTKPAARDIQDIRRFTRNRWGSDQAVTYHQAIRDALIQLCDHPNLGRERSDMLPGIRSYRVLSHSIFYLVANEELVVQRILHERMDVGPDTVA
jgi:toxin ParE1/3/4